MVFLLIACDDLISHLQARKSWDELNLFIGTGGNCLNRVQPVEGLVTETGNVSSALPHSASLLNSLLDKKLQARSRKFPYMES